MAIKKVRNLRESLLFRSEGSILIVTLLALALLTVFCVQLGHGVRQKLLFVGHLRARERLRLVTEAGVKAGIAVVKAVKSEEDNNLPDLSLGYDEGVFVMEGGGENIPAGCSYSDEFCRVDVTVTDEGGRINLNRADEGVIGALFQNAAGLDESAAMELAYCVVDWRDADFSYQHAQYGAEDKDYRGLSRPYEAKDSEFEILDELKLIKGMSDEIFEAVADDFTVYGSGQVNINAASTEVLSSLGFSDTLAGKILSFRLGDDSIAGTGDDNTFDKISEAAETLREFALLSVPEAAELDKLISKGILTTDSDYCRIKGVGKTEAGNVILEITAVIKDNGTILFWQEE